MKCPNGHEVNGQVKFCPICGADLRGTRFCTNCGYERNGDEDVCPRCGTTFNTQEAYVEETDATLSNRSLLIILSIIVIAIIGVGCWLYFGKGGNKNTSTTTNNEVEQMQAVDSIEDATAIDNSYEMLVDSVADSSETFDSDYSSSDYSSSSSDLDDYETSSSKEFLNAQYVVGYLAHQTFTNYSNVDIRFDGDGSIYIDGDYAGVVSVLRYNSTSALLRYSGGSYGEGKIGVRIEDNRLQLRDPVDGTVWYQK